MQPYSLGELRDPAIIILDEVVLDHESVTSLAILRLSAHTIQDSPSSLNPATVIFTRFFMKASSLMSLGFLSI